MFANIERLANTFANITLLKALDIQHVLILLFIGLSQGHLHIWVEWKAAVSAGREQKISAKQICEKVMFCLLVDKNTDMRLELLDTRVQQRNWKTMADRLKNVIIFLLFPRVLDNCWSESIIYHLNNDR